MRVEHAARAPHHEASALRPNDRGEPSGMPDGPSDDRRMSVILADVWDNADRLVGQHLQLALSQLEARAHEIKSDLTVVALGGFVLYAGLLALLAAVILGLTTVLPAWLAALIVSLPVMATGYFMLQRKPDITPRAKVNSSEKGTGHAPHRLKEAVK